MPRHRRSPFKRRRDGPRRPRPAPAAAGASTRSSRPPEPRRPWTRDDVYRESVRDLIVPAVLLLGGAAAFTWSLSHLGFATSGRAAVVMTGAHVLIKWLVLALVVPPMMRTVKNLKPWPATLLKFAAIAIAPDAVGTSIFATAGTLGGAIVGVVWTLLAAWLAWGLLVGADSLHAKALSVAGCVLALVLVPVWWLLGTHAL